MPDGGKVRHMRLAMTHIFELSQRLLDKDNNA
jgi:hypothetical protein